MFTLNICPPAGYQQVVGDVAGGRRWPAGWQDTCNPGLRGLLAGQGTRQVGDMGGSWEQQWCKADGTEVCPPVDGKAIGLATFSTHRTNCLKSILSSLLITQNYVRGLNCWVLPCQMFNLLVTHIYALKQRCLWCYKFLLREKSTISVFWRK